MSLCSTIVPFSRPLRLCTNLSPRLQFDDISLRISHIAPRHPRSGRKLKRNDFPKGTAAGRQDRLTGVCHIIDRERDVSQPWPVDGRQGSLLENCVCIDLQRWSIAAVAGKPEMDPLKV